MHECPERVHGQKSSRRMSDLALSMTLSSAITDWVSETAEETVEVEGVVESGEVSAWLTISEKLVA